MQEVKFSGLTPSTEKSLFEDGYAHGRYHVLGRFLVSSRKEVFLDGITGKTHRLEPFVNKR
jgi:hypothetical protein